MQVQATQDPRLESESLHPQKLMKKLQLLDLVPFHKRLSLTQNTVFEYGASGVLIEGRHTEKSFHL